MLANVGAVSLKPSAAVTLTMRINDVVTLLMRMLLPVLSAARLESLLRMVQLFADAAASLVPSEPPTPPEAAAISTSVVASCSQRSND